MRQIAVAIAQNLIAAGRPKEAIAYLLRVQQSFSPLVVVDSVLLGSSLMGAYLATGHGHISVRAAAAPMQQIQVMSVSAWHFKLAAH